MFKIHLVVGARPNYIKADPVCKALADNGQFKVTLVNTGQHYDEKMARIFFEQLGMQKPDIDLEVGSGTHGAQTASILKRYEKVILDNRPDLVMVFGDVNSTLACSLASVKMHIPVAHVEAGLRSFDRTMPEEINRLITDQLSTWLFTTSTEAAGHLIREGKSEDRIFFVGNTMIDSLVRFSPHFDASSIHRDLSLPQDYCLMTFHRPSNVDDETSLKNLVSAIEAVSEMLHCVFPVHPRTRNRMKAFNFLDDINRNPRITLSEPLGYIDFMALQKKARVVLTDSGGIQEETTIFGVPCLTVRDNTERPITIDKGTNRLIGTDYSRIPAEVEKVLSERLPSNGIPDLWDGKAAERIATKLGELVASSW